MSSPSQTKTIEMTRVVTKSPKDKYEVVLHVMHGDADKFEDIKVPCANRDEFMKMMSSPEVQPLDGSAGGDEDAYQKWCAENFYDYVPRDCIYSSTRNLAKVDGVEGFYYDENGTKFKCKLIDKPNESNK